MAVNTDILVYSAKELTAQDFAILTEHITPQSSGVLQGCTVTAKGSSTIHVSSGWCVVRGRLIRVEEGDIEVTIPSSGTSTQFVVVCVDLSNDSMPCELYISPYVPDDSTDFNVSFGQAYLKIAGFILTTSGITTVNNFDTMSSAESAVSRSNWSNYQWYHHYIVNTPATARGAGQWTNFTGSNISVPKSALSKGMYLVNYTVNIVGSSPTLGAATVRLMSSWGQELPAGSNNRGRQTVPISNGFYATANATFIWNSNDHDLFACWPEIWGTQAWYPKDAFVGISRLGDNWTRSNGGLS